MPVKRWNFRKVKWSHYIVLTNKFAKILLLPDSLDVDAAYQDFCNTIKKAAKKTIPHGYRNNYIPCWDAECNAAVWDAADDIASQLVRNGKYKAVDHKLSRLVSQKVSDLWRATTPHPVNISGNFLQREFTAALQHLKPGKAPGLDSICPELILHAGAALKSWLRDFLSSCLHRLKIPKIWRRALVVAISKPTKPVGDRKSY